MKNKGFAHIILLVGLISIAILFLGSYLFVGTFNPKTAIMALTAKTNEYDQIKNPPALEPLNVPAQTPNPFSDWKTYTFDEIGLTFMAPKDLDVNGEIVDNNSFTLYIQNNSSKVDTYYQLYVLAQWQNPYKESDLDNIKTELEPSSIESVTVAGYKGVRGQYKGQRNRFVTNFIKDGALYSAATSQPTKENETLSNQILSTFKFTK